MPPPGNKWLVAPQALRPPAIHPKLETLDPLSRAAECFRHLVLSTEFWLSPNGRLRWWLKVNLRLLAWLLFPTVILTPIVNLMLYELNAWLSVLTSILGKLIVLPILVLLALASVTIVWRIIRVFMKR